MTITFVDSADDFTAAGSGSPVSSSVTISATGSRMVVAWFWSQAASLPGTKMVNVLFDGVAPTAQITPDVEATKFAANAFSIQCYVWLDADLPAVAGTYACTATTGGSDNNNTGQVVQVFNGVFQAVPGASLQGRATSTSADTSSSVTVTPAEDGSFVIDCHGRWEAVPPADNSTPGTGQVEVSDFQPGNASFRVASSYEPIAIGGSPESQTWSWVGSTEVWTAFCLALSPTLSGIQIEVGNYAQGDAGAGFSHTLSGNPRRVVVVMVNDEGEIQPTGVTYDGVAMDLTIDVVNTNSLGNSGSIWTIDDAGLPGPGTFQVVVSGLDAGAAVDVVEVWNAFGVLAFSAQTDTDIDVGGTTVTTAPSLIGPSAEHILIGFAGNGGPTVFNDPPTGDGTFIRLAQHTAPPTSAQFASAYQIFASGQSGTREYIEVKATSGNRMIMVSCIIVEFLDVFACIFDSTGTFQATLQVLVDHSVQFDGLGTFNATLSRIRNISAQFDGAATFQPSLSVTRAVATQFDGVTTFQPALSIDTTLATQFDGQTIFQAFLTSGPVVDFFSLFFGNGTFIPALTVDRTFFPQFDGAATFQATLVVDTTLEAQFDGVAQFTATLIRVRGFSTQFDGVTNYQQTLAVDTTIAAQFDGVAAYLPSLGVDTTLAAQFDGSTILQQTLAVDTTIAVQFDGAAVFSPRLLRVRNVSAAFDGVATLKANLHEGLTIIGPRVELDAPVYESLYFSDELDLN